MAPRGDARLQASLGYVPPHASAAPGGVVLHWFRRALRLHDNPALVQACRAANAASCPVVHLYVLDSSCSRRTGGALRRRFVHDALCDLDRALRAKGSRLFVTSGKAESVVPDVAKEFRATAVFCERETAKWARDRDAVVAKAVRPAATFSSVSGLTLYDTQRIVAASGGKPPVSMQGIQAAMSKTGPPESPLADVEDMPPCPAVNPEMPHKWDLPSWDSTGVSLEGFNRRYVGGEAEALQRMEEFLARESGRTVASFEKPNTSPAEFEDGVQETTVLSPHLAIGTLSPRLLYHRVRDVQVRFKKHSGPPVSLIGQLMFRELFHVLNERVPNFEQIEGNEFCRQIQWDEDDEAIARWKKWEAAETGFPWIDALMMQLKTEGFVHHLGRHSLACFLTRGDLYVSWERGAQTFEEFLVDYDEALNAANWMWLSASAFFSQYFRVYSPVAFAKRWSAAPAFIRNYLPVLKHVPDKYIFEPWKMPSSVARQAGVEIEAYGKLKDTSKKPSKATKGVTKKRAATRRTADRSGTKTYKMSK